MVVDLEGRLQRFTAAPDTTAPASNAGSAPNWSALFAAAGLDMARFSAASPEAASSVISDRAKRGPALSPIVPISRFASMPRRSVDASPTSRCRFRGHHRRVNFSDQSRAPIPLVVSILILALLARRLVSWLDTTWRRIGVITAVPTESACISVLATS